MTRNDHRAQCIEAMAAATPTHKRKKQPSGDEAVTFKWLLREEDGALCLDGYPIRIIRRHGMLPFTLVSDFHGTQLPYATLAGAQLDAYRLVEEIECFTPEKKP